MGQRVLVIEAATLQRLGEFQGYCLDVERYLPALLDPANHLFMPRQVAERDPRYKQLVPYVVLRFQDSVFSYVRGKQSGEARLVALRSIGLGGHIEPQDQDHFTFGSGGAYCCQGARREVNEEVEISGPYVERVVALINDDSRAVGRVHLGIVQIWDLAQPAVRQREGGITQAGFATVEGLKRRREKLERWSQIALEILDDPRVPRWITTQAHDKGTKRQSEGS